MRDILDKLDEILTEANLGSPEIPANKVSAVTNPKTGKLFSRPELFLHKVMTGSPFTLIDGGDVTIDPKEARNVKAWIATGPRGIITLNTTDGGTVKNTQLLKTIEFGSKESETIKLKGSDIFATQDTDIKDFGNSIADLLKIGGFPASEMYNKISDSPQIKKLGKIGDAVILMARQASEGQVPEFPKNLSDQEKKAIELYASEYIGVLGLLSGATKFPKRKEFDEFLGNNLNDMVMFFPKSANNPLADSFSVVNDDTGHAIKISSKAAGKGAPPALGSLKLPDDVRKKYPEAANFFDAAILPGLSAYTQPFAIMNWLAENSPDSVPREYAPLLPFTAETIQTLETGLKTGKPLPRSLMRVFEKRISPKVREGDSSDAGKAWYAVTKDIMEAINEKSAVPGFQAAVIESLGYNFIQLYSNMKGNKLVSEAFWPAKISGKVRLKTKGSSKEPTKGKISVEISPGGSIATDMGPETGGSSPSKPTADLDQVTQRRSSIKASGEKSRAPGDTKTLGRKRR